MITTQEIRSDLYLAPGASAQPAGLAMLQAVADESRLLYQSFGAVPAEEASLDCIRALADLGRAMDSAGQHPNRQQLKDIAWASAGLAYCIAEQFGFDTSSLPEAARESLANLRVMRQQGGVAWTE